MLKHVNFHVAVFAKIFTLAIFGNTMQTLPVLPGFEKIQSFAALPGFWGTYHNEDPLTTEEPYHMFTAKLLRNKGTDIFETTRQAYPVAFEGLHHLDQPLRSLTERHG